MTQIAGIMENATPMLRQYLDIKKSYPGTILFFRLGDFYEMFNEDAIIGARELQITLTAQNSLKRVTVSQFANSLRLREEV